MNAVCARDSVLSSNFTCVCNSGYVGDGFTCESELFFVFLKFVLIYTLCVVLGSGGPLSCECTRSVECSVKGVLVGPTMT